MLRKNRKKTKLVLRKLPIFLGVIFLSLLSFAAYRTQLDEDRIVIGDTAYIIEVVSTPTDRQKGLSNRPNLPQNSGMLFVFEQSDTHCFWMKNMNFAIDIVWMDNNKQIVDIASNVLPGSYPESFCPQSPAQFVLEINAGEVESGGISIGDQTKF